MAHYVGVLDGADDVWGVRIPDLPGCVGGGATPDAALADAIEALRDVVAHKRDGGCVVPPPATFAAILASGEIAPGETAEFPVVYFVDPRYGTNADTEGAPEITLSYTFFPAVTGPRVSSNEGSGASPGASPLGGSRRAGL